MLINITPVILWIQMAYLLGTVIWILLFFWMQTYFPDRCWASWIFLFISVIVFAINFLCLSWSETTIADV